MTIWKACAYLVAGGSDTDDHDRPSFKWCPRLGTAVQATELPRLVCKPLKHMSDVSKGLPQVDMAEVHGGEGERLILQCPDLQVSSCLQQLH